MTDITWKKIERIHAALFGASGRTGPTGQDLPDWIGPIVAGETKCYKKFPGWLHEFMQQAEDNNRRWASMHPKDTQPRIPVVVMHQKGEPTLSDFVVIRLSDFLPLVEEKNASI